MINEILKYTGLFVVLLAIQVLLLNNIQFSGYVNPYVYILFILLLPFEISSWMILLLSFATGIVIDLTTGTLGLHTAATVFAGFSRPWVLQLISPHDGYETGDVPGIKTYGLRWFLSYIVIITLLHHFALFYIEVFRFDYFFRTMLRVISSSGFTVLFIIIIQALIVRR